MNKSRPKQIVIRVSEEELLQIKKKVEQSGIKQQDFLLKAILEKPVTNTDGIKEVMPELKRIGNNLNQIAKQCNEENAVNLRTMAETKKIGEELNGVWLSLKQFLQKQA
jgi:hypothetical protein